MGDAEADSVKGKVVWITGASSGIGAACAERFAHSGARLLLAARRLDRLEKMRSALKAAGAGDVHAVKLDVRNSDEVQNVLGSLPEPWQAVEILVNNAGLSRGLDKLQEGNLEDWEEMIDTNVKGLLYVTRFALPGMIRRGRGHVINIGSTAGHMAYPRGAVYCATKAAELRITEGLRQDLLGTPVRTTTIDPGMVETDFSKVRFRGDEARAAEVYRGLIPLRADDVADAVLWAASRPAHVNIHEIILTSIDQADSHLFHREKR
ncbi:MAG: SDR family NAD(P)-dependent oxidoreductase [Gemmataceae bacterium]